MQARIALMVLEIKSGGEDRIEMPNLLDQAILMVKVVLSCSGQRAIERRKIGENGGGPDRSNTR